jgi:hypothetical protein
MNRLKSALAGGLLALSLAGTTVSAHGSSHPPPPQAGTDGGQMVDAVAFPRAIVWDPWRLWQAVDGRVLVCPFDAAVGTYVTDHVCELRYEKATVNRWMVLQDYQIPGMVLKTYEFRMAGSSGLSSLIAYYGPPAAKSVPAPVTQVVQISGPVTVNASSVVVNTRNVKRRR